MPLNYVDIALLAVAGIFSLRGLLRGFVGEVAGLVGLLVGLVLARMFAPQCSEFMEPMLGRGAPVAAWGGLLLGGMVIIGLLARLVQKILHIACAGWLDHLLGLGIGAIKGAIIASALAYVILWIAPEHEFVKTSQVIPPLFEFVRWVAGSLNLNITLP